MSEAICEDCGFYLEHCVCAAMARSEVEHLKKRLAEVERERDEYRTKANDWLKDIRDLLSLKDDIARERTRAEKAEAHVERLREAAQSVITAVEKAWDPNGWAARTLQPLRAALDATAPEGGSDA